MLLKRKVGLPTTNPVKTLEAELEIAVGRRSEFEHLAAAELAKVNDPGGDYDAELMRQEDLATIERKVSAAKAVEAKKRQELTRARALAEAAAREAEEERQYAAGARMVAEHQKLIRDILARSEGLAALLAKDTPMRSIIDRANKVRGNRPYLYDGEYNLRRIPGRRRPAIMDRFMAWVDAKGSMVPDQIYNDRQHKWVSNPAVKDRREVETVRFPESVEPDTMPERLCDVIRLVGLKPEPLLWPR
jgi:hypothetical protein